MDDALRKRDIVDYVLQTRRQILKLLALVRWSSEAENLKKCMSIIGFLGNQNFTFSSTVTELADAQESLANARVRNYDIPTALAVLTQGTYTRLPSILKESFAQNKLLTDDQVLKVLQETDKIIRWRLSVVEDLPKPMMNYTVADGRATFVISDLLEASFTYASNSEDDEMESNKGQWYLLSIKFLFRVADTRGSWSQTPKGPIKEAIDKQCNSLLMRRPDPQDKPLVRAYYFLTRLALVYQLQALTEQATRLAHSSWAGAITVDRLDNPTLDTKTLRIQYWSRPSPTIKPPRTTTTGQSKSYTPPPPLTGELLFTLRPLNSNPIKLASENTKDWPEEKEREKNEGRQRALEKIIGSPETPKLDIQWKSESIDYRERKKVKLELDNNLDLTELLELTTSVHARWLMSQMYDQIGREFHPNDVEVVDSNLQEYKFTKDENIIGPVTVPSIKVFLFGTQEVLVTLSPMTGRLDLKGLGDYSVFRETRLRNATEKVDADRRYLTESLARARSSAILDQLESRISFIGFNTTRRFPVRTTDYLRLGTPHHCLYVILPQLEDYYLVVVLFDDGLRFALVETKQETDGMSTWVDVIDVGWIEKGKEGWFFMPESPSTLTYYNHNTTVEEYKGILSASVQRISLFQLERQLYARKISFIELKISENDASNVNKRVQESYIVINSQELLTNKIHITFRNIAIKCRLTEEHDIRTTFFVRFKDLEGLNLQPDHIPKNMTFDPKAAIISLSWNTIENCIANFLSVFSIIIRAIVIGKAQKTLVKP